METGFGSFYGYNIPLEYYTEVLRKQAVVNAG